MFLGIDPSTKSTGWGVIDKKGKLVDYGVIVPDEDEEVSEKLSFQQDAFLDIIKKHNIKYIGCEDQFFGNNPNTLKKLVQVSATAVLVGINTGVPVQLYYPSSWRKITHGTGKANKKTTQKFVNETYNKKFLVKENDITDAIGIAYATYLENK